MVKYLSSFLRDSYSKKNYKHFFSVPSKTQPKLEGTLE